MFKFEALQGEFAGNTLNQWLWACVFWVGGILLSRLVYWLIEKFVKMWAKKSKTNLDDLMIGLLRAPVIVFIVLMSIYVGFRGLTLSPSVASVLNTTYAALMTLNVTWLVSRVVQALLDNYVVPKAESATFDSHFFPIVRKVLIYIIWGFGLVVSLNNAGYDVTAMIAGLGIGGLALAMAAQDSVSNFFGGFTIFTDHPFKVKDRIRMAGHDGTVEEVGLRSFRIRTLDGTQVVVPNSQAVSQVIENVTNEPSRKIKLQLGLTYDTTPEMMDRAIAILEEIGKANENVHDNCKAYFTNYGDFSLSILFVYFIRMRDDKGNLLSKQPDVFQVQSEVNREILRRFNAEGLNFAFPTHTVYTVKGDK